MLNQSFEQVFVASTPVLLAQGTTVDLAAGQIGIFDAETYQATTSPTYAKNKAIIFAQGRTDLSAFGELLMTGWDSASDKSKLIKGKNIVSWSGKKASRGQHEIITVGFDGADITKNLTGAEGLTKNFYLRLTGNPLTKQYSPDGILRHYIIDGGCVDCLNGTQTNPEKIADELVKAINGDKYVNKYVRASKLLYTPTPVDVPTIEYTRWTVTITDNGDLQSNAAVQAQYPGKVVKFIERNGTTSTYEIIQLASLATPAAVSISQSVFVPDCPTCPAGFTLQAEQKLFLVERPLAPTTDLSTPTAKQTYADTIKTAYDVTGTVATITVTNGGTTLYTSAPTVGFTGGGGSAAAGTAVLNATGGVKSVTIGTAGTTYTNGTHPVVFTGGGGIGATGTATVAGGIFTGFTILTPGTGYTSAPTVTVPAAGAGSGTAAFTAVLGYQVASVTITNVGTGYTSAPTVSFTGGSGAGATATAVVNDGINIATFVSNDNGVAKVLLYLDSTATDLVAKLSDVVTKLDNSGAYCTPPAGTTATWTNTETLVAYQKTVKVTVGDDCGEDVLEEIQAQYPDLVITLVAGTPEDSCTHLYETVITSTPVSTDCSIHEAKYTLPHPYKGSSWVEPVVADTEAPEGLVAGVKIEAAFVDRITNECTYDFFSKDYDGVHIEASYYNPDYNADPCDTTDWPITKIQGIEYEHGDGYMVRQREERQLSLLLRERSINPGVREAENYVTNSKLHKYYDEYTLGFEFNYKVLGWSQKYEDSYRLTIYVEEGQGKALEAAINSYITSASIGLDPVVL